MESLLDIVRSESESNRFDIKEKFANLDHSWLELIKDISSFANRDGGFIVFGIVDKTNEIIGIDEVTKSCLSDCSEIKKRLQRYINLDIEISVLIERYNDKELLGLKIIGGRSIIYAFEQDGTYAGTKGDTKFVFKKGQVFVRGDGRNEHLSGKNQQLITERIIQNERDRIFLGISKVVNQPEIYTITDKEADKTIKFSVNDPAAQRVVIDIGSMGQWYGQHEYVMEMIRAASKPDSTIERRHLAQYMLQRNEMATVEISPENRFLIACKIADFPIFYCIDYKCDWKSYEQTIKHFECAPNIGIKGRMIMGYKVLNRDIAKDLIGKLKPDEKRWIKTACSLQRDCSDRDFSISFLGKAVFNEKKTSDTISKELSISASGVFSDLNVMRKVVALDYAKMKVSLNPI